VGFRFWGSLTNKPFSSDSTGFKPGLSDQILKKLAQSFKKFKYSIFIRQEIFKQLAYLGPLI
jgi:hypothetical protein